MIEKERCTYALLDLDKPGSYIYNELSFNAEPYYVGQGHLGRPREHYYVVNKGVSTGHYAVLTRLLTRYSIEQVVTIINRGLTKLQSLELEHKVITSIGRLDLGTGPLYNISDGGTDGWGFNMKVNKAYMTGNNNHMKHRDNIGSNNLRAKRRCIVQDPSGSLYYLCRGTANKFADHIGLSASTMRESSRCEGGILRTQRGWKDWLICPIPEDISINDKTVTVTEIDNIINELRERFRGHSFGKYIQVNGNSKGLTIFR